MLNPNEILDRIKLKKGFKTDGDLAAFLGLTQQNMSAWRKREKFDFGRIMHKCEEYDFNWLFKGEESKELTKQQKENEQFKRDLLKAEGKIELLNEMLGKKTN
jgi:hypothetical protein